MGYHFIESDVEQISPYFDRYDTFAFDVETTGLSPYDSRLLLASFGFPEDQFVIDVAKTDISALLPYLKSRKWKKIFFNGKFDEQFMIMNYKTPILNVFDCYVAEKVISPESTWGNSFEDLALSYLQVRLDKDVRKSFYNKKPGPFTEDQIKYSAEDVEYLFPLMEAQIKKLQELNLENIAELEFDVITVVSSMELEGVPINPDKWNVVLEEYREEHKEQAKKVLSILFDSNDFDMQMGIFEDGPETLANHKPFNLASPKQLKSALKTQLGINVESTGEQVISQIKHPIGPALLEYRGLDKIMTSYGGTFLDRIHPFTGRIHADWKQIGAGTGRFSCAHPNLQQIPEKFRECIGGAKDMALVGADFSQIELRILAEESKDPILVDAFTTGKDIHKVTASTMFGLSIDNITKEQRYAAKTLNFGITYGMKAKKFVDMMNAEANKEGRKNITFKQGKELMERYKETYKVATKYLDAVGLQSLREGVAMTRLGRKRFFNPVSTSLDTYAFRGQVEAIKRAGANMPIQGTSADITKMALIAIHEELKDYGFRGNIILQVHDEIVVLAHKTQAEAIKPIVTAAMVDAGQRVLPSIPVVVDTYVSDYWSK